MKIDLSDIKVCVFVAVTILILFLSVSYSMKLDDDMFKEGESFKQNIVSSYNDKSKGFNHPKEVVLERKRYKIVLDSDKIVFKYSLLAGKGKFGTSKFMQARKNGDLVEWYCGGTLTVTKPC